MRVEGASGRRSGGQDKRRRHEVAFGTSLHVGLGAARLRRRSCRDSSWGSAPLLTSARAVASNHADTGAQHE